MSQSIAELCAEWVEKGREDANNFKKGGNLPETGFMREISRLYARVVLDDNPSEVVEQINASLRKRRRDILQRLRKTSVKEILCLYLLAHKWLLGKHPEHRHPKREELSSLKRFIKWALPKWDEKRLVAHGLKQKRKKRKKKNEPRVDKSRSTKKPIEAVSSAAKSA